MLRLIAAATLLCGASALAADKPKTAVSLEAEVVPPFPDERRNAELQVVLVGGGKAAAVVTDGLRVAVATAGKKATVTLQMTKVRVHNGRLIVPSEAKLGIVKLQPGEVATVAVPDSPDLQKAIQSAVAGTVELVVEYEVSEFWGSRFGVADGRFVQTAPVRKIATTRPPAVGK